MQKIIPLITYFPMQRRKSFPGGETFVLSIGRWQLFKLLFTISKITRIFNGSPVGKNRKTFQAKVNSYPGRNGLFGNGHVLFAGENDIPLIPGLLNGAGLYHPANFPVPFHFQPSDFRNRHLVGNNFKSGRWIANGMQPFFPFESWKTRCLTLLHSSKKMLKRNVQSFKNILQNLGVTTATFREVCLYRRQFILLVRIRNRFTDGFVSRNPMLQRCIVKPPAQIELLV